MTNTKFMVANITWNSSGWKQPTSSDRSNFKWVKEHPESKPTESWNFEIGPSSSSVYGGFQTNDSTQPTHFENGGIVFFFSKNLRTNTNYIVGYYGKAKYLGNKLRRGRYSNLLGTSAFSTRLLEYVPFTKDFLPAGKQRIGRCNFMYLSEKEARRILAKILQLNSHLVGKDNDDEDPLGVYQKIARTAKRYFPNIKIPKMEMPKVESDVLGEFLKKEIPQFQADDRINMIKNNKKLRESYERHQKLLNLAIPYLEIHNYKKLRKIFSKCDIEAVRGRTMYLVEAKSCDSANIKSQVLTAVSQLFHYEYEVVSKTKNFATKMVLLIECLPPNDLLAFLVNHCGIQLWYKENKSITKYA